MNTHELVEQVPALTRADLYHYERQGYIKPKKVSSGKGTRNEYSERDLHLVQLIHYYRQLDYWRGRNTRWAYERALDDVNAGRTTPPVFR